MCLKNSLRHVFGKFITSFLLKGENPSGIIYAFVDNAHAIIRNEFTFHLFNSLAKFLTLSNFI